MNYCCYILIDTKDFKPFYVGKTSVERLLKRKAQHKNEALKSKRNVKIFNKIKKIINEGFEFEIVPVKFYETEEKAYQDENNVIEFYRNLGYCLYNTIPGGGQSPVRDPVVLAKIKKKSIERLAKPILQYDLYGNFIKEYIGINEAANVNHVSRRNIQRSLKNPGSRLIAGNFFWRFKTDLVKAKINVVPKGSKAFKVEQIDLDNKIVNIYNSMTEATIKTQIKNISRACSTGIQAGGFYWRKQKR